MRRLCVVGPESVSGSGRADDARSVRLSTTSRRCRCGAFRTCRVWGLRDNLAAYVALAEALDALLLTADGAMGKASGVRCEVELLA